MYYMCCCQSWWWLNLFPACCVTVETTETTVPWIQGAIFPTENDCENPIAWEISQTSHVLKTNVGAYFITTAALLFSFGKSVSADWCKAHRYQCMTAAESPQTPDLKTAEYREINLGVISLSTVWTHIKCNGISFICPTVQLKKKPKADINRRIFF